MLTSVYSILVQRFHVTCTIFNLYKLEKVSFIYKEIRILAINNNVIKLS